MNNTYIVPKETIKEVFDDIKTFEKRIALFREHKPEYKYELKIKKSNKENMKWELCAKIWKDEQTNDQVPEEVVNPFGVL